MKNNASKLFSFIINNRANTRYLITAITGMILQLAIFKYLYPYADYFGDSFSYIEAASLNLDVSVWPIGYSKFLRLVHMFSHSDLVVVCVQYLSLQLAAIYLFFSLLYFFELKRASKTIIFVFLFFNPLFLYLSNYINSDPLFATLSIIWFTQLLWIVNNPKLSQLLFHSIILFLAFTVRNNAYYYPFITAIAFLWSNQRLWGKIMGIIVPIILISVFVINTRNAAYKMTGVRQFSFFTGWQLANNALYAFPGMKIDEKKLPTPESRQLYQLSKNFYNAVPKNFYEDFLKGYIGNYFIIETNAPLKQYMIRNSEITDDYSIIVAWGKASGAFAPYGEYLIKNYPLAYVRYFMLLNARNYVFPPLEKLDLYNLGRNYIDQKAQNWFDYPTPYVSVVSYTLQAKILFWVPYLFLLLNVYYTGALLWYIYSKKFQYLDPFFNKTVIIGASFVFINFLFSVFAAIIVFRYQFFPMIILMVYSIVIVDLIERGDTKRHQSLSKVGSKEDRVLQG